MPSGGRRKSSNNNNNAPVHVIDATVNARNIDFGEEGHLQPPATGGKSKRKSRGGTGTGTDGNVVKDKHDHNNNNSDNMEEDHDLDEEEDVMTLGDRVRALEVSVNGANHASTSEKNNNTKNGANNAPAFVPPKADSLATLLAQALAADDNQLLERCLSVHDKRVIETTVGHLSGPLAMKLLSICLDNMKDKPNRGERLAKWCRATLVRHAGFASVSPNAQRTLAHLQSQIDARTAQREPLLQLMGRLDLLLYASSRDEVQDANENARLTEDERGVPAAEYHEAVDVLDDLVVGGGGESEEDDFDEDNSEGEEWETDDGESEDDDEDEEDSEDEEDPFVKADRKEDMEEDDDDDDDDEEEDEEDD